MFFSSRNCRVSSVNLAEVGEENTVHICIQNLSFRDENDFLLKPAGKNFPRNSFFFLVIPKNMPSCATLAISAINF